VDEDLSLLGRMAKFHVLEATPNLYRKPSNRGLLIFLLLCLVVLLIKVATYVWEYHMAEASPII